MIAAPARLSPARRALFLDVDGTLLEIAATPETVAVPAELKSLLTTLSEIHQGALALVSGRPISQLDELFAPLRPPAAGLHGMELRNSTGTVDAQRPDPERLQKIRSALADFTHRHPGTLLEDKGGALALHYRLAPEHGSAARATVEAALSELGREWQLLEGKRVFELKPRAFSKGTAIKRLMASPPFAGRIPVFVGDDVTDESAFAYVNACGGESIHVGTNADTCARHRLSDVAAVHAWLKSAKENLE